MIKISKVIGREREKSILTKLLLSSKAEFLAIYGRRRIGKTYLIRNFFKDKNGYFFHVTGIQKGSLKDQLEEFSKQIADTFYQGAPFI